MEQNIYLASDTIVGGDGTVVSPSSDVVQTETVQTSQPADAPVQEVPSMLGSTTSMLFMMVAVFAIMYFFTIRPQKKREKELREIQKGLQVGDWVLSFSGMYGKVVDIGTDLVIVEFGTNKGVKIPMRKAELTKSSEPVLVPKKDDDADDKKDKKEKKDK